jgi:hypothetical protein
MAAACSVEADRARRRADVGGRLHRGRAGNELRLELMADGGQQIWRRVQ